MSEVKPETIIKSFRAKAFVNMKCGSPALMEASAKGFFWAKTGIKPENQVKPKWLENAKVDGEDYAVFEVGEQDIGEAGDEKEARRKNLG